MMLHHTVFICLVAYRVSPGSFDETEYRLIRYLMSDYDKHIRPSVTATMPINVSFGLSLTQIINVDERNQVLTTSCWLNQAWIDFKLKWDPRNYGNISVIRLPETAIWKPDIILYNNLDQNYKDAILSTYAIVSSDGNVTLLSAIILHSSCRISVRYFPFDEQNCSMKFASWTYDGFQINLIQPSDEADLTNYVPNGEWELIGLQVKRNVVYYSCCIEPYPDLTYSIRLRRRPLFYIFNFVMPCVLITAIALLGFYMPSDSGEKVTLGITTLLSMTVFMMLVAESMPPTSEELPLIGVYYGVTIVIVSLATGMTVFTLNLHHKGYRGREMPPFLKRLALDYLAKFLLLNFETSLKSKIKTYHGKNASKLKAPKMQQTHLSPLPRTLPLASYPNFYCEYIYNNTMSPNRMVRELQKHMTTSFPASENTDVTDRLVKDENALAKLERQNIQRLAAQYHTVMPVNAINYNCSTKDGTELNSLSRLSEAKSTDNFINFGLGLENNYGEEDSNYLTEISRFPQLDLRKRILTKDTVCREMSFCKSKGVGCNYNTLSNSTSGEDATNKSFDSKVSDLKSPSQRSNTQAGKPAAFINDLIVEKKLMIVLEKIQKMIDITEARMWEQDTKEKIREEWMQLAIVMDRILLIIFVVVTVLVSFFIIYSSPYSKLRRFLESRNLYNTSLE